MKNVLLAPKNMWGGSKFFTFHFYLLPFFITFAARNKKEG
jgi:hypothetical protein